MSKGAQERMLKKLKDAEEHKKRLVAMKAAKKKKMGPTANKPARPKFDRSKLNNAFMNNAKQSKDEVQGWALDFDNEAQNVVIPQTGASSAAPKDQTMKTEDEQLQKALQQSLDDQSRLA